MDYKIVKFLEENDAVAVIPSSWITRDGICVWPPSNVNKMAKKAQPPDLETWTECKIGVVKSFESYKEARENLRDAQYSSDLEKVSGNTSKPKKLPPTLPVPFDPININPEVITSDVGDSINEPFSEIESTSVASNVATDHLSLSLQNNGYVLYNLPETTDVEVQTDNARFETSSNFDAVMKSLISIKLTLSEHGQILTALLARGDGMQQYQIPQIHTSIMTDFNFPLSTPDDMERLENLVGESEEKKLSLIGMLSTSVGFDLHSSIQAMLMKIMDDVLASKFSLKGARGKLMFENYRNLRNCLFDTIGADGRIPLRQVSEKVLNDAITTALKKAADRVNHRMRKPTAQ